MDTSYNSWCGIIKKTSAALESVAAKITPEGTVTQLNYLPTYRYLGSLRYLASLEWLSVNGQVSPFSIVLKGRKATLPIDQRRPLPIYIGDLPPFSFLDPVVR